MKNKDNIIEAFFALLKAGLWEREAWLSQYGDIDFKEVYRIAEEQSVVGLIAAGLDRVSDINLPKEDVLQIVGSCLQVEQRNRGMNDFLISLIGQLRTEGVYTLLLKGQGIAQCYEKPLWRACGDIDLFLSEDNFKKARGILTPQAHFVETEVDYDKHLGMTIDSWVVELHGNLRVGLSRRMDKVLDRIKKNTFYSGYVRSWIYNNSTVFLLGINSEVVYVFSHILQHFYKGGIGLRQICDWCRLLWTYKSTIDKSQVEKLIRDMGVMTEWKAFGAFAVEYLGMPKQAMPLYEEKGKWQGKAKIICNYVLSSGNFGHNRDMSYYGKYPYLLRKVVSLGRRIGDLTRLTKVFPLNSVRFMPLVLFNGFRSALKGE